MRERRGRMMMFLVPLLLCFAFFAGAAFAQGQTAPSIAKPLVPGTKFMVNKIEVTGSTLLTPGEIRKIVAPFEGKREDLAALDQAAAAITAFYRKKGYLLARAYVPPQTVENGTVQIDVIEGRVENLMVIGNHAYSTAFIKWFLQPAIKNGFLDYNRFEKALMLLSSFPDLEIRSFLKPGSAPGTTDIVIAVKDSMPLHEVLSYNNYGQTVIGRNRAGLEVWDGNLTGRGDYLDAQGIDPFPSKEKPFISGSYSMPVSSSGTKIGASYENADIKVGGALQILDIRGTAQIGALTVAQPLARTPFTSSDATATFSYKNVFDFVFANKPTSKDRLRELTVGYDQQWTGSSSRDLADISVTRGLGRLFGGMPNNDPLASRVGASDAFSKVNADYAHIMKFQFLDEDKSTDYLILRGSGQYAFNPLSVAEEYAIGGPDTVRGYPQSSFLGDTGWNLSAEYRHPLTLDDSWYLVQTTVFLDTGYASIRKPAPGQLAKERLTGTGIGLRLGFGPNTSAAVDVGFPLDPIKEGSTKLQPVLYAQFSTMF